MLKKIVALAALVSAAIFSLLVATTTPSNAGPLGILVIFATMYLMALGALTFLFYGTSHFISRMIGSMTKKPTGSHLTFRDAYYYGSVAAMAPVMIIAMQSVGQAGVYQLLLVVFFVAIAWIYVTKRKI